jgi:2'-5' RNA ligase
VTALGERIPVAAARLHPVTVRLCGAGFFPDERRPRVAWVGGQAPGLESWADVVEGCAEEIGVPRERRPFAVHLTLARVSHPWGMRAVEDFRVRVGKWVLPEFLASEMVLFESVLRPSGAVYTALARWPVGGG